MLVFFDQLQCVNILAPNIMLLRAYQVGHERMACLLECIRDCSSIFVYHHQLASKHCTGRDLFALSVILDCVVSIQAMSTLHN